MKLTILGSGTCLPTIKRNSPGYYLECGKNNMLIDCGSGTLRQMVKAKIDYFNLENIIISHAHPDHIGDLISICQSIKILANETNRKRVKKLDIYGPRGFKKIYQDLRKHLLPPNFENYPVNVYELKKTNRIGKIMLLTQLVPHKKGLRTLGLIIKHDKKVLAYTSDTDYDKPLIKFIRNSNLLITDCSFPDSIKKPGHMIPSECAKLASESNSKKLMLSHIYPVSEKYNLRKQAQKHYKGPVIIAKDLMKINI